MMTPHIVELVKSRLLLSSLHMIDMMCVLFGSELSASVIVVHSLLFL